MGTYYFLLNDTKKLAVHLDGHIKEGPITKNEAVQYALINYMFENQQDIMRMVSDRDDDTYKYSNVDLLAYPYNDNRVVETIVEKLNKVYGRRKYAIVDGKAQEIAQSYEVD